MSARKEDFARQVLGIQELFFGLTQVLSRAGETALQKNSVQSAVHSICVLPKGIPGITRRIIPLGLTVNPSTVPTVHFDHRSITVVGGAAVQLYALANGPANSNYVQTTDIDAVWWPKIMLPVNLKDQLARAVLVDPTSDAYGYITQSRVPTPENNADAKEPFRYAYTYETGSNRVRITAESKGILMDAEEYAVTSSSWAIQSLVVEYTNTLQKELQKYVAGFVDALRVVSEKVFGIQDAKLSASAKYENLFQAGIANVWGYIVVQTPAGEKVAAVKIIEMTIHDGASSQRSTALQDSQQDIVYSLFKSAPGANTPHSILHSNVPSIRRLLDQQMFALEFRKDEKLETTLRRIKFLHGLLSDADKREYAPKLEALCTKREYTFLCAPAPNKAAVVPSIPAQAYPAYGVSAQAYPTYKAPAQAYPAYGVPTQAYSAYGVPTQAYSAYGVPAQVYPAYKAPAQAYGVSTQSYGVPAQAYGVQAYGVPAQAYPAYGVPVQAYPAYGVPVQAYPAYGYTDVQAHATYASPFHPYGKPKRNPRGKQGGRVTRKRTTRSRKSSRRV